MVRTAEQWIQGHNERNAVGQARVAALMAAEFVARTYPSSLQAPNKNREEYIAFQSWAIKLFDSFHVTETDMIVDDVQCKVIYYLNAKGTAPAGDYKNEYVHKLILTEDGKLRMGS